jgi:hypothetical protein
MAPEVEDLAVLVARLGLKVLLAVADDVDACPQLVVDAQPGSSNSPKTFPVSQRGRG